MTPDELVARVAAFAGLEPEQLRARGRKQQVVAARHVAIHLCVVRFGWSEVSAGQYFGVHRSSCRRACSRVRAEGSQQAQLLARYLEHEKGLVSPSVWEAMREAAELLVYFGNRGPFTAVDAKAARARELAPILMELAS